MSSHKQPSKKVMGPERLVFVLSVATLFLLNLTIQTEATSSSEQLHHGPLVPTDSRLSLEDKQEEPNPVSIIPSVPQHTQIPPENGFRYPDRNQDSHSQPPRDQGERYSDHSSTPESTFPMTFRRFTGIIVITLVATFVSCFFIKTCLTDHSLKKRIVQLNCQLWQVSTAYENQLEDLDTYKHKASAFDEEKARNRRLEAELVEARELIESLQNRNHKCERDLRNTSEVASDVEKLVDNLMKERDAAITGVGKMKKVLAKVQLKYTRVSQALLAIHSANSAEFPVKLESVEQTPRNLPLKVDSESQTDDTKNEVEKLAEQVRQLEDEKWRMKTRLHSYWVQKQALHTKVIELTASNLNYKHEKDKKEALEVPRLIKRIEDLKEALKEVSASYSKQYRDGNLEISKLKLEIRQKECQLNAFEDLCIRLNAKLDKANAELVKANGILYPRRNQGKGWAYFPFESPGPESPASKRCEENREAREKMKRKGRKEKESEKD